MTPKQHLETLIDRYTPEVASLARRSLARMRKLTPGAIELVYDNYNALVIAFASTERAADLLFSIALYPRYPTLFFARGAELADPTRRLRGSGRAIRHIVVDDAALFDAPDVRALIDATLATAKVPLDPERPRRLVIRAIVAKQRPRRPKGG